MAQLAIKGHATRGEEVIQLLEMLGGVNVFDLEGAETQGFYYISKDNNKIYYCWNTHAENTIIYTLEEFEKKFPYKVGDDVLAYAEGCLAKFTIQDIRWNYELNKVEYKICSTWLDASLMQPHKEETIKESIDKTNKVIFDTQAQCCDITNDIIKKDMEEIKIDIPKGYEFFGIDDDNKIVLIEKQPQYPKTYDECCEVLGISRHDVEIDLPQPYQQKIFNLFKLHICRDAYWKIVGDEMGLDKPWNPDWNDVCDKYTIYTVYGNEIWRDKGQTINTLLAFPTMKMRDTFYENFKDLIKQCKELL